MNYRKLLGRIKEYGYTQRTVAPVIGISECQLSQKLKGVYSFKQPEIQRICEALEIQSDEIGEYFFRQKVEKHQIKGGHHEEDSITDRSIRRCIHG